MLISLVTSGSGVATWRRPRYALCRRCGHWPAASTGGSSSGSSRPPQGGAKPTPALPQMEQQAQQGQAFDIVSGRRLPQAQGPSCDWPRPEQRKRWEEAALITTGFPVPSGYGAASRQPAAGSGMLWRLRNPERESSAAATAAGAPPAVWRPGLQPSQSGSGAGPEGEGAAPVVPVFRASPYSAEAARQRRPSRTARILLLDDGCTCRAPLAATLLQSMLSKLPRPLDVEVLAASIGPPVLGGHDERVAQIAREMGVPLPPRRVPPCEFDEMRDTVDCDLILVMDRYDRQEVVREVSVLERLNPGGAYLTRVHCLGEFARAGQLVFKDRCLLVPDDVPDPFYGVVNAAAEQASLRHTMHTIALCCRGLVSYLLKLTSRCGSGLAAVPLRVALAQSLQCPVMDPTSHHALSALIHCQLAPAQLALWQQQGMGGQDSKGSTAATQRARTRLGAGVAGTPIRHAGDWAAHVSGWPRPVWVEAGAEDSEDDDSTDDHRPLWTVREVGGQTVVVRRPRWGLAARCRGYWSSADNVQKELSKWMEAEGLRGRLPSQQELRRSGANTLSAKIDSHGGLGVFAERMGLPLASGRVANGHWSDFEHLARELRRFVEQQQVAGQVVAAAAPAASTEEKQQEVEEKGVAAAADADAGAFAWHSSARRRRPPRFASSSWSSGGGGLEPGPASAMLLSEAGSSDTTGSSSGQEVGSGGNSGSGSGGSGVVFLPTQQQLRSASRTDLIGGIRQHGGALAVARRLGWAVSRGRLPSESAVVAQLLDFAEQQRQQQNVPGARAKAATAVPAAPLAIPTLHELEEEGRVDLAAAVMRLGGVHVFAHLLEGEQQQRWQRQRHRQQQEQEQQREWGMGQITAVAPAAAAAAAAAAPAPQPQQQEPQQHGLQASQILSYPGGGGGGGQRLPAPSPPQPAVVWVGQAVVQLIEARGWDRRVPTKQELVAAGRRDLHAAIVRCGGAQKLAEHLQLPYAETRGRRKRSELEQQQVRQGAVTQHVQLELHRGFLASRLRPPPGAVDGTLEPGAAGGGGAGSAAQPRPSVPPLQRLQGPASRLLEKELVLEAYQDITFV